MYKKLFILLMAIFISSYAHAVPTPAGDIYSFELGLAPGSSFTFLSLHDPSAPGDIFVTFDGISENLQAYQNGLIPMINESETLLGGGVNRIQIQVTSPSGTDLFPGGLTHPDTGEALIRSAFRLGYWFDPGNPLDLSETANVLFASREYFSDGTSLSYVDLTSLWSGFPGF